MNRASLCARMGGTAAISVLSVGLLVIGSASADAADHARAVSTGLQSAQQSTLVSAVPADFTPNIDDGVTHAIAQVGSWIIVGGTFTHVTPHGSSSPVGRTYVLAFDQSSGALSTMFAPVLDGEVRSVQPGPVANSVYVGGAFSTVNGKKSKSIALLSLSTGKAIAGFVPPAMNGSIYTMRTSAGRLFIGGSFTTISGVTHDGLATISMTTGALDPYVNVQLTGHHNFQAGGTGSSGSVGARAMDISPDGTRAIVLGNFKDADGVLHDQIIMLDLNSGSGVVDPNWNTSQFTASCFANLFDTYVEDVDFSPDGSYFAIAATGGKGTNTDGTNGLCDSASRWTTSDTGTNVKPVWVDYTGTDTFWSIAVTGTAVYVGGHQRWVNNFKGPNIAGEGAVARPGIVALDPVNGMPFSWNPGRNPRGAGAYALLATSLGLYVGSDTDFIGNRRYLRQKIAFFPLSGGETLPSMTTDQVPGKLYSAGPTNSGSVDALNYHTVNGSTFGPTVTVASSISWSSTRGVFAAGSRLFWGSAGSFFEASFNGTTVGTPAVLDPYDDPAWDNVDTGSGQTYQGVRSDYYTELPSVTGAFFSNGRLYYSLAGKAALYWRYFEPESGVIGAQEFHNGSAFQNVAGMVLSGSTLYYANKNDGTLHTVPFSNGSVGKGDKAISGPKTNGIDWRARSLFIDS